MLLAYFSKANNQMQQVGMILMGVFTIKGAKDCVYTHKVLHPYDFEKWLHEL